MLASSTESITSELCESLAPPASCHLKTMFLFAVRDGDTVKHYRIRQLDEGGFFIARRVTFRTLSELVEHYSRDADGLCVNLRKPCSQVSFQKTIFWLWVTQLGKLDPVCC